MPKLGKIPLIGKNGFGNEEKNVFQFNPYYDILTMGSSASPLQLWQSSKRLLPMCRPVIDVSMLKLLRLTWTTLEWPN